MRLLLFQSPHKDDVYCGESHNPFAPMWGGEDIIHKDEAYPERGGIGTEHVLARQKAKEREVAAQAELEQADGGPPFATSGHRLVAQDDEAEEEEMEWLRPLEPIRQQPANLKPLILQMLHSTARKQENGKDAEARW